MGFERKFADTEKLKSEPLFQKCLLPDIINQFNDRPNRYRDVFPAIRKDRIDFYYKGGKLFSFDGRNGFKTHHKYASVIKYKSGSPYVSEAELKAIDNFIEGYERIKENCSLYSGDEAVGVSLVYGNFSCAKRMRQHAVVVLDIEVCLQREKEADEPQPGEPEKAESDRIDLLLFDTESRMLRFFEAKDFSNSEIRSGTGRPPSIVSQMERYKKQLNASHVRQELLSGYSAHVDIVNQLFTPETPLPMPEDIDPVPRLLIFGFDESQLKGKLKKEIARLESEYELAVYAIGNINAVKPVALFSGGRKRWPTPSTKDQC